MSYKNWIPYEITLEEDAVKWLYLNDKRYTEPFFEETISYCRRQPENYGKKTITSIAELEAARREIITIPPTAFIFHISRCGSTLMTQLLSLQTKNIVISEAPILDAILRWKYNTSNTSSIFRNNIFKYCVNMLGQKRFEEEQNYFIKLDSWHLMFLDEIRAFYPNTPFIFMARNLEEIIKSHKKIAGMQAVPGILEAEIFDLNYPDVLFMEANLYLKHVLQSMSIAMQDFMKKDDNLILLNYENGVYDNYLKTLEFLNMAFEESNLLQVKERLNFHSKNPHEKFEPVP